VEAILRPLTDAEGPSEALDERRKL
jgi:hypothetical protein